VVTGDRRRSGAAEEGGGGCGGGGGGGGGGHAWAREVVGEFGKVRAIDALPNPGEWTGFKAARRVEAVFLQAWIPESVYFCTGDIRLVQPSWKFRCFPSGAGGIH
jgi:hypothetical protein